MNKFQLLMMNRLGLVCETKEMFHSNKIGETILKRNLSRRPSSSFDSRLPRQFIFLNGCRKGSLLVLLVANSQSKSITLTTYPFAIRIDTPTPPPPRKGDSRFPLTCHWRPSFPAAITPDQYYQWRTELAIIVKSSSDRH